MKFLIYIVVAILLVGCATTDSDAVEVAFVPSETEDEEGEPEEDILGIPEGMGINRLTGMMMPEENVSRRPVAIVINNLRQALPQSGIGQADILYEVLAEGNITRLVGIFLDFEASRIGPVRSARSYFIDFARNHDAIFIHHGASPSAYTELRSTGTDRLDGMFDAQPFWRDQERVRRGLYEHSSYTSYERIWEGVASRNIRDTSYVPPNFMFFPMRISPRDSEPAAELEIRFSNNYVSRFSFDHESGLYLMSSSHGDVIDEYSEEQLSFTNVIVQLTSISHIPGDAEGRRNVTTVGTGTGYLFTNGSVSPISWSRQNTNTPTIWLNAQGLPLALNVGRTYIAVHNIPPTILDEPNYYE